MRKLLDADGHGRVSVHGLRAVRAEQCNDYWNEPIPPWQVEAVVTVGLARVARMVDSVHVGRHHDPAQGPVRRTGNPHVAVVEDRGGVES